MIEDYLPIGLMVVIGVTFGVVMSRLSVWLAPRKPTDEKLTTYESGMEPVRTARERFSVKFYLVAMLFLVFDIEVVFLYPWAVNFKSLGWFGLIEMFVFIVILLLGYVYILMKGALQWD